MDEIKTLEFQTYEYIINDVTQQATAAVENASAVFYTIKKSNDTSFFGKLFTNETADSSVKMIAARLSGSKMVDGAATSKHHTPYWRRGGWNIESPVPKHMNKFSAMDDDIERRFVHETAIWQVLYEPLEIEDQLRALVYDGGRFVGWFGMWRRGVGARFSEIERARLNDQRAKLLCALRAADSLERESLEKAALTALADSTSGRILYASKAWGSWLTTDRMEQIKTHLCVVKNHLHTAVIDNLVLRFVPTLAADRPLVLIVPGPQSSLYLQPERILNPRQREIAQLLSLGLSEREIAQLLELNASTIKYHKSKIFDILGIFKSKDLIMFNI
jgi:DNA-binding CsgD family transcriptional regulator